MFDNWIAADEMMTAAADTTINQVLRVQREERVLIVTNPVEDVHSISIALYDAAARAGGIPVLVIQPVKTQIDFAEPSVLKALASEPEVMMSISAEKMGKDPQGMNTPYEYDGESFDHIFDFLLDGKKTMRALWTPSITSDIFTSTVCIDYEKMKKDSLILKDIFDKAEELVITARGGTDLTIGVRGREGMLDNGDYGSPGDGGNLPAGETFISPELNTSRGVIFFDASISSHNGEILIEKPIQVAVDKGYVTEIRGGAEADQLKETLRISGENALEFEAQGKLKKGMGEIYARNAGNIGELGVGLNPKAQVIGNMLVDEKALKTCHIAIGSNYDDDAPALTHLDGLIHDPTITARYPDGTEHTFMKEGVLCL